MEIPQEPVDSLASVSAISSRLLSSQGHLGAADCRAPGIGTGSFTQPTQAWGRICVAPAFRSGKNAAPWAPRWVWTPLASPHCQLPSPSLFPVLTIPGPGEVCSPAGWGSPQFLAAQAAAPGWLVRHMLRKVLCAGN